MTRILFSSPQFIYCTALGKYYLCVDSLLKQSAFALCSAQEVLIPWAPVCSLAAGAAVGLRAEPCGAGWAVQAVELWDSGEVILLSLQQILH